MQTLIAYPAAINLEEPPLRLSSDGRWRSFGAALVVLPCPGPGWLPPDWPIEAERHSLRDGGEDLPGLQHRDASAPGW